MVRMSQINVNKKLTIFHSGHCRRRKIRCQPANDDPQQRCANCIKLKKECSFLPVDHPPNAERRPRTGSSTEIIPGEGTGSSPSSPPIAGIVDHVENFNPFPPLPLSTQDYPPSSHGLNASAISPHSRGRRGATNDSDSDC